MGKKSFRVFHYDYRGDEPWICNDAFSHEDAAEQYRERSDQQYELAGGGTYKVIVESDDGSRKNFIVGAEQSVDYQADE